MKKIIRKIIVLLFIVVLMDFIPIKMAIKIDDKGLIKSEEYLCIHAQVTGGNWEVQNYAEEQLYFEFLHGNNPFYVLSKNFTTDYIEPTRNRYIFTGNIIKKEKEIYDLDIHQWEIVYPIQRKSFRILYAPKSYLTIYDFNFIRLFCYIFDNIIL